MIYVFKINKYLNIFCKIQITKTKQISCHKNKENVEKIRNTQFKLSIIQS